MSDSLAKYIAKLKLVELTKLNEAIEMMQVADVILLCSVFVLSLWNLYLTYKLHNNE